MLSQSANEITQMLFNHLYNMFSKRSIPYHLWSIEFACENTRKSFRAIEMRRRRRRRVMLVQSLLCRIKRDSKERMSFISMLTCNSPKCWSQLLVICSRARNVDPKVMSVLLKLLGRGNFVANVYIQIIWLMIRNYWHYGDSQRRMFPSGTIYYLHLDWILLDF